MQDEALKSPWYRRVILTVLILAVGAGGTFVLVKMRKRPKREPKIKRGLLVQVLPVKASSRRVQITSHGQVQPRREVGIVPQVSGKLTHVHPSLVVGGMIRKGERLLVIDPADYRIAVDRALAGVAKAEQAMALEESSGRVARGEWKLLGKAVTGRAKPSALTLREPQLRSARAGLASARADLRLARLNLSRTTLRAPFSLRVRSETVEVGQFITTGKAVAQVYGTDTAEVLVPLPAADLQWLQLPRGRARGQGSPVVVRQKAGATAHERQGRLVRSVGEIDATGRMSRVVVAITDPFNLQLTDGVEPGPVLERGAFVEVVIQGKQLPSVYAIPAEALRLGFRVWVVGPKETLQIRKVTVARRTVAEALISAGLKDGDRVVLTNITGALQGMKLRVKSDKSGPRKKATARHQKPSGGRGGGNPH